jgi:integrase/recombinase XerD
LRDDLDAAVHRHLRRRRASGITPATLYGDRRILQRLTTWMQARRLTWPDLDYARMASFVGRLRARRVDRGPRRGKPILPQTVELSLRRLDVFFRGLLDDGEVLLNPMVAFHQWQPPAICGRGIFSVDEMARIFDALAASDPITLRDRAAVAVLYGAGLRVGELVRLTLGDYDADAGVLAIREAKGGKDREVTLGPAARADLDRYLAEGRPFLAHRRGHAFLFVNHRGGRAGHYTIRHHFKKVQRRAGLTRVRACHALRHACASHMLAGGADLCTVQKLLGHASLLSTSIYTHVDLADMRRVLARAHPRERGRA